MRLDESSPESFLSQPAKITPANISPVVVFIILFIIFSFKLNYYELCVSKLGRRIRGKK